MYCKHVREKFILCTRSQALLISQISNETGWILRSFYAFVITSKIPLCQSWSMCKRNLTGMCVSKAVPQTQSGVQRSYTKSQTLKKAQLINALLIEAAIICYMLVVHNFLTQNLKQPCGKIQIPFFSRIRKLNTSLFSCLVVLGQI